MSPRVLVFAALGAAVSLAGCGGHGAAVPATVSPMSVRPPSVSPALVKPAPMAMTNPLPASAMRSPADRHADSIGRGWTQLPGSASQVAAGYDGSLWVLSTQPGGTDKYIWHYANGQWTNLPGLASQIAIDPTNGTLWAINSGGGIWHYSAGAWTSPGGGARSIGIDANGDNIFVVSNAGSGPDYALWQNNGGSWQQLGGSGVVVGGNADPNQYPLANGSISGNPGTYILNSQGQIWYENNTGTSMTYGSLPGAASAITETLTGGVFVLTYPANGAGNAIYYYNYYMPGWVQESGAATSISTDGISLYAVGGSGSIYKTTAQGLFLTGGSTSASFNSSGGTYAFPQSGTYDNVSVGMTWGSNNATGSFPVTVNWGLGGDLPSSFVALPNTIGTPLVYLDLLATTTGKVSFTQTPSVTVTTATSFPGTKCGFAFWGSLGSGGAPTWNSMAAVGLSEVTPSGKTFSIPPASLPFGSTVDIKAGEDQYFALYCH